ncbi:MAG: shikimate kinase [Aeropyrum sp.]|nr:shikimate kinase [Aeropyrum sp.]MCE4616843.1 shikimate kinase [Aeropyrum sp.]
MSKRGCGEGFGGLSVLNAIATGGVGGAVSIDLKTKACVTLPGSFRAVSIVRGSEVRVERRVLEAVASVVEDYDGSRVTGFDAYIESDVPPASGLKSSSALTAALVSALTSALSINLEPLELAMLATRVSINAGLTVTGAFDDHVAAVIPGVHITVNRGVNSFLIKTIETRDLEVGVAVKGSIDIRSVTSEAYMGFEKLYSTASSLAIEGRWLEAMRLNGLLTSIILGAEDIVAKLYRSGAISAGVSGKGPAIYSIPPGPLEPLAKSEGYIFIRTRLRGGGGVEC